LQLEEGGDLVMDGPNLTVAADGMVSTNGHPVGRLAVVDFEDRSRLSHIGVAAFSAEGLEAIPVSNPMVRQGMLESSNVNNGDEMVAMMEGLRRAESAQRLVTTYDDLMGRALTLFGQQ
jgi:flagellar basal body rod protein FlgG